MTRNSYDNRPTRPVNPQTRQTQPNPQNPNRQPAKKKKSLTTGGIILRLVGGFLIVLLTAVVILAATLLISMKMICSDANPAAQSMFVTTLLETGQMKSLASWFVSPEKIQKIVDANSMKTFDEAVDDTLIAVGQSSEVTIGGKTVDTAAEPDVQVIGISGSSYYGTLMIVKDPSRVSVATIYPWQAEGIPLKELVEKDGAIGGMNGGLYNSFNNSGGAPYGVVVSRGEIQLNEPQQFEGLVLIGLTEDNILQIISMEGMTAADVEKLVADKKIRDAVTFQEESSDANNHFVQLIINGQPRELNGTGSGQNPRTCIGQRADGALLLFVTDGRAKSGHLGATASDLINVMMEYGAVNAANLDGGSSSCMYYEGEYLMDSVTFYLANSSWKLPCAFVLH